MHYYSNHPWMRPLMTLIKDTVDYDKLKASHGEKAEHNFIYPSGRCQVAMHEQAYGEPNLYNCDWGLLEGIAKVAGEEVALQTKIPNAFMHFQAMAYDKDPTNYSLFSGKDVFKRGDYVELLAHDVVTTTAAGAKLDPTALDACTEALTLQEQADFTGTLDRIGRALLQQKIRIDVAGTQLVE